MKYGQGTSELIKRLYEEGVKRMFVIMRHGDRHYDTNPEAERFMGLTAGGKQDALEFGLSLPRGPAFRFFSSSVGRCIETAYQVEKGCIQLGAETSVNKLAGYLTGFFVGPGFASLETLRSMGQEKFFQAWFDGRLGEDAMADAGGAARRTVDFVRGKLAVGDDVIDIGVSHDWNLYLLRDRLLGQTLGDVGPAQYLHGIVVFEREGVLHGATEHGGPCPLLLGATPDGV